VPGIFIIVYGISLCFKNREKQMESKKNSCPIEREDLVPRFCEVISSNVSEVNPLLDKLMDVVKSLPCAPQQEEEIRLALYEALANAILHGNENDPGKKVSVACFCECGKAENLLVVIRDEGAGFDPNAIPDPRSAETLYASHGRGIFLMRKLMDDVSFLDRGREVEIRKVSRNSE
jgi:serine/threonine-protein kinase RsbW